MSVFTTIIKALSSDRSAFANISESPKWNKWGILLTFILAIIYSFIFFSQYRDVIYAEFETELFQKYVIPALIFLVAIGMVFLTRITLTLLLWAAGRGFGGGGLLGRVWRSSIFALVPSILAMPGFITSTAGDSVSVISLSLAIIGLLWMYILFVRTLETTQNFVPWKAYAGAVAIFIFFFSIYFIVTPPAA